MKPHPQSAIKSRTAKIIGGFSDLRFCTSLLNLCKKTKPTLNRQVRIAIGDDAGETVIRVKYLVPYILQSIDLDTYGLPLEAWQLQFYYQRERFLQKTKLRYGAIHLYPKDIKDIIATR